jgi:peroxiredoxin
MPVLGRLFV